MESKNSDKSIKCSKCDKVFSYPCERERHEKSHSKMFRCKYCCKQFNFLSAQIRHEKQHQRTGFVQCDECDKKFTDTILLKRHKKYAHKGTFVCTSCESSFGSEQALQMHKKIHTSESEWQYRCTFDGCTKIFKFSHHLKHHVMKHANKKQHHCSICGKGFIQGHHLKNHMAAHNPDKWLECSVSSCKKKYPTAYSLKRHLATHGHKNDRTKNEKTLQRKEEKILHSDSMPIIKTPNPLIETSNNVDDPDNSLTTTTIYSSIKNCDDINRNDFTISCKDALNGCLITGSSEISDDCLCSQIEHCLDNDNNNKIYGDCNSNKEMASMGNNTKSHSNEKTYLCKSKCDEKNINNVNTKINEYPHLCCGNNKNKADFAKEPLMEFRVDGSIKIKELVDTDLTVYNDFKEHSTNNNLPEVPYSCKEIIGSCIVSGDSTTGEGCICAKMSIKENETYPQTILELTPFL